VKGIEGVAVYVGGRYRGKTNASGELLIPDLYPYYPARIHIDTSYLPIEYELPYDDIIIVPE
jgi:outer membrane usher protein FimD/PapC